MSLRVLAIRAVGGDPDGDHARLAEALRERVPAVRWVASYRTRGGSFDFVDVLAVDVEDDAAARAVAQGVDGLAVEWAEAEASALLRAPGGAPGGPPGGAPGGAPGGP